MSIPTEERRSAMQLRDRLVASDYIEVVTYSFISKEAALAMSEETPLALLNPMASHQSVMRTSLLPGLLDCLATNVSRKQSRVRVFEIGRCFLDRPGQPSGDWTVPGVDQPLRIAGLAFGPIVDDQWGEPSRQVDFFDVKRDLEALAQPLRLTTRQLPAAESIGLHPGRAAQILIGDKVVGRAGELHPKLVQQMGLASPPVVFEMALDGLTQVFLPKITDVSRFPSVTRDLAVVVDHQTPAGAMIERLERLKSQSKQGSWITNIKCFDEYRGKGLSEKEKSLAFRFILQSPETTLQESEVDALMNEIITLLASEFSARLRS
jgi:phenylalanyl-tRNA synthetase beta chain